MKHYLLLAAAITGLCCAASTPWAQIKNTTPRAKTHAQSSTQARIRQAITNHATPSQFMPKTIKAYGRFDQTSSFATANAMASADFAIQSKSIIIDTTTCTAEYADGLLTKLSPDNKCQYIIENSDGEESARNTMDFTTKGTIKYFHNSKNLIDSAIYNFDYRYGEQTRNLSLYHRYGYNNDAQWISYSEKEYANGNVWYSGNTTYDYKEATDNTPESVTTLTDGFLIKRFTVLETNSQGAPTKVNYIYGSFSSEKIDTTYEIVYSDIKWGKANAPSKILKLGLDMSYAIYNDITLQNVLQNWVTNENQIKSCNYKLNSHSRFYSDHNGTVTVDVADNKITINVKDSVDSEYDNTIIIERKADGTINVDSKYGNSYSLYLYPDDMPDYAVKFITGTSADIIDMQRTSDFTVPTTIGDKLYSPEPFTLEYDNNGALTRITYKSDTSDSSDDGTITQEMSYVIMFSDFNPYTGISQPEAKALWKAIGGNGSIEVSGVDGEQVAVYAINGRLAYNAPVAGSATISVPAGIYIVKVGAKACKVIAR